MHDSYYNKHHKGLAKSLRSNMTKAEACLWKYALSASQRGVKFRRQRPIAQYIADFVCLPLNLIIEVDGLTHEYPEVIENDKIRQRILEELGFVVLRFDDEEVLNDINRVILHIDAEIERLMEKPPPPRTSAPPPEEDNIS